MTDRIRQRRTSADVRELILGAAGEAFARKGFGGARLSAIAEASGVSKSVLFRHFATKEDLFTAAALEPFRGFAAHWENLLDSAGTTDLSEEQVIGTYVEALLHLVQDHRDAVRAYLIDETVGRQSMEAIMDRLVDIGRRFAGEREIELPNIDLRVRFSVAMVVSVAALDGWIPQDRTLSAAEIAHELATIAHRGVLG